MGREIVRRTPIPPQDQWIAKRPDIVQQLVQPGNLDVLYAAVSSRDVTVIRVNGEHEMLARKARIHVFYASGDKAYQLWERRFTVNPGKNPEEVLEQVMRGNTSDVTAAQPRPDREGLSESMKLNGESREECTLRAFYEEMFKLALERSARSYPDLNAILKASLRYEDPYVEYFEADNEKNTFPGIRSRYFTFPASITFTPDMDVPIEVLDGEPQPLFEFEDGKYIHRFDWVPVER